MTKIEFLLGVTDKLGTTTALIAKARMQQRKLTIYTDTPAMSDALSQLLWQQAGFFEHSFAHEASSHFAPVVLSHTHTYPPHQDDVLINLCKDLPKTFSRFLRLIELVGTDALDKTQARARYRFYRDCGYALRHINTEKPSA